MSQLSSRISIQLTRFLNISNALQDSIEGETETFTRHLINTRLDILEKDWSKFESEHEALCREYPDDLRHEQYVQNRTYERCREFYVQTRSALHARQEELDISSSSTRSIGTFPVVPVTSGNRRGLPKMGIPKFSGDYSTWQSFHDLFLSMVGNNSALDNVEKMHYLKTSLTGDAAKLVVNIAVTEDSFAIAWNKLVNRYENKRLLISSHLDKLTNVKKITSRSASALNGLLSTLSESMEALDGLGCTRTWDALLVHLFSRLLDDETRELWEGKIGPTSSYPTLKEFEEFVIGRARTWESLEVENKSTGKSRPLRANKAEGKSRSLMATTSGRSEGMTCPSCKGGHYLYGCPQFQSMTAQRRRRFVTEKRLCYNCFGTHPVNRCNNNRRCLKCGHKHHSMIHDSISAASSASASAQKPRAETSNKGATTSDESSSKSAGQ